MNKWAKIDKMCSKCGGYADIIKEAEYIKLCTPCYNLIFKGENKMKDISETHPSLKTSTSGFGWKVATDFRIQEATIDKTHIKQLQLLTFKGIASDDIEVLRNTLVEIRTEIQKLLEGEK